MESNVIGMETMSNGIAVLACMCALACPQRWQ